MRAIAWRSITITPANTDKMPGSRSSVVTAGALVVSAYEDYNGAEKGEPVIVTPPIKAFLNGVT